jgi:hypothetical protein
MTDWIEWDAFPERRRKPRIQVLPPPPKESPRLHRVELTIKHHRRAPSYFLPIFVAIVAVLLVWRLPFGFLMLGALAGSQVVSMFLFVAAVLALLAWRDRRGSL